MKRIDLYNVLISPIITEKSNTVAEKREQVVFKVLPSATKLDIKQAFELVFEAKVDKVSTLNVQGKTKRFGKFTGKRANWKKAYICLTPGQKFDLASNQK
ncbi:MAG: ribosomal protein [Burkholderiales bacterium]|jgi:large subunit ribosomal protein L23|nr:ribosomal protein [Burkholderiales bacterium]MCE3269114.1 ribosomal protein [Burkholderiales bacterium]